MAILTVGPTSTYATIAAALQKPATTGDILQLETGYGNEVVTIATDGLTVDGNNSSLNIQLRLGAGISGITLTGTAPINVTDSAGANTIVGNSGDNVFTVSSGVDVVQGGSGNDRLIVDYTAATLNITGTTVNVTDGGTHAVTFSGVENFTIATGIGNDTLTVADGANVLNSNGGNDTITAGNGVNIINGGGGNDTIIAGNGGNTVDGGSGDDGITTGTGADIIISGLGNDTIISGGGADAITVNGGIDTADGGSGTDLLIVDFSSSTTAVNGGVTSGTLVGGYNGGFADAAGTSSVVFNGIENITITTGSGNDVVATGDGADVLDGGAGTDTLTGNGGDDRFIYNRGGGADTITDFTAGPGTPDKIVLTSIANLHNLSDILALTTQQGANAVINFGAGDTITLNNVQKTALSADDFVLEFFKTPAVGLAANFNPANGWTNQDQFHREMADVNGDGNADIVGFGNPGVLVSIANGDGTFAAPTVKLAAAFNPANGWTSDNSFHREMADVNGDHMADIVGFGNGGVLVSLATGGGSFATPTIKLAGAFNPSNGWTSQDANTRELADVNGDGKADIVGFGNAGVLVSLATSNGNFAAPTVKLVGQFNSASGYSSQDANPRELADVNGDGMADIIGFSSNGVQVSLATGNGNFAAPIIGVSAFDQANGWTSDHQFLRQVADVNDDGMADIIGFGNGGVYVSLATGAGHFAAPIIDISAFNPANGWTGDNTFHREVADVNHDGSADIVGFGNAGVLVSLATDYHLV